MLRNFHKTTSEPWWRTPHTQKGSPFSSKGGRTNYKRQKGRQKSQGWRPILGREWWRRRGFQTAGNALTDRSVGSFGISEGNITGRKKKQYPRENAPKHNSQRKSSPDALIHQQWAGAGQGGTGCMLRVRTRPECPEDNLRELTWDSNPNCGAISRERKKKRERKRTFPQKALI